MLATAVHFGWWADGCIRLIEGGHNLPRGPLGVLCYLPFVPIYWLLPARHRPAYLWISSLVLAVLTLGPAYAVTMLGLAWAALLIVRTLGARKHLAVGAIVLAVAYLSLILHPQPGWLPPVGAA